ncbi:MAG: response regulator transcription factor [Rubrivivax sp.]|nr:response regulator transcription factor [Rubrivivax sp.]
MSSTPFPDPPGPQLSRSVPRTVLALLPEPVLRELLIDDLRRAGLQAIGAVSLPEAQRLGEHVLPDALVVDIDEDANALGWALQFGAEPVTASDAPLRRVVLARAGTSAQPTIEAQAAWPADGAARAPDLWVSKPVHARSLALQIVQLLRPARAVPPLRRQGPLRLGPLEIERDRPSARAQVQGRWHQLDLPETEHRLLLALAEAAPHGLNREQLKTSVWGTEPVTLRAVDQYVKRLRARLQSLDARDRLLTLRSFGYRLDIDPRLPPVPAP